MIIASFKWILSNSIDRPVETSDFSDGLIERRKPQIDDIYYNVNELQRLSNQGVDISKFMVANGIESSKKRIGTKSSLI